MTGMGCVEVDASGSRTSSYGGWWHRHPKKNRGISALVKRIGLEQVAPSQKKTLMKILLTNLVATSWPAHPKDAATDDGRSFLPPPSSSNDSFFPK